VRHGGVVWWAWYGGGLHLLPGWQSWRGPSRQRFGWYNTAKIRREDRQAGRQAGRGDAGKQWGGAAGRGGRGAGAGKGDRATKGRHLLLAIRGTGGEKGGRGPPKGRVVCHEMPLLSARPCHAMHEMPRPGEGAGGSGKRMRWVVARGSGRVGSVFLAGHALMSVRMDGGEGGERGDGDEKATAEGQRRGEKGCSLHRAARHQAGDRRAGTGQLGQRLCLLGGRCLPAVLNNTASAHQQAAASSTGRSCRGAGAGHSSQMRKTGRGAFIRGGRREREGGWASSRQYT